MFYCDFVVHCDIWANSGQMLVRLIFLASIEMKILLLMWLPAFGSIAISEYTLKIVRTTE